MSSYTIASGPFDYYALMHMAPRVEAGDLYPTNHLFDVSDHRSQTDFYPVDYIPELDYPPCDLRPSWRRCFTVTDQTPGASESQAKPFRLCRNPGCVGRRRLCFPNGGPPGTMGLVGPSVAHLDSCDMELHRIQLISMNFIRQSGYTFWLGMQTTVDTMRGHALR